MHLEATFPGGPQPRAVGRARGFPHGPATAGPACSSPGGRGPTTQRTAPPGDHPLPPSEWKPTKANKATSLIGMEVRGPDGKPLGKIHDIVFDLKTERVSYGVLNSGGGLFASDKLHAVPLRAFQVSLDGTYLTLQADRARLEQARGFDPKNWPSLINPVWGAEPFWQPTPQQTQPATDPAPDSPTESQDDPAERDR
ncbi:MAG: PRC-barrel domain-containing protein [Verrucomicrobia bacterium]|nr:PRC-barrel domain-containing protein [Verrucomicrobiota bacterium]